MDSDAKFVKFIYLVVSELSKPLIIILDELDSIVSLDANAEKHLTELLAFLHTFSEQKTIIHSFLGIGSYKVNLLANIESLSSGIVWKKYDTNNDNFSI